MLIKKTLPIIFIALFFPVENVKADDYALAVEASKKKDFITSYKLLKGLAEKGDIRAQGELGALYISGRGVARDTKQGLHWTMEAARKGLATAQYNLGTIYLDGEIVTQNYPEAMKWFLAAAGQGVPAAQSGVAAMFYEGYGVKQDFQEAAKWMKISASNGDPEAQLNLGTMYAFGQGVDRDVIKGAMWTLVATESETYSNEEKTSLRDMSMKTLRPEEIEKVKQAAMKCKQSKFKDCM